MNTFFKIAALFNKGRQKVEALSDIKSKSTDDVLVFNLSDIKSKPTDDLLRWLHENGSYINPKVAVKPIDETDPNSTTGLIAIADLNSDEVICRIPPHLIIMPDKYNIEETDCSTIDGVYEMLTSKEPNPWARYLLSQPKRYTPEFWSTASKAMLKEMTGDVLPPQYINDTLEEIGEDYGRDTNDPIYLHAAMMVKSRADYSFLVPFYDMTNHHNGKVNLKHLHNPFRDDIKESGYKIATTKAVSSGDQLFLSYNQGNICQEYYDWFGTPEIFQAYGFVEDYPQRWLFDLARIKFDLSADEETGEDIVTFLVAPSKRGIGMLKEELKRLEVFAEKYRAKNAADMNMLNHQWELLWQYFDALHNAVSRAVESNEPLSEEIWDAPHDWWVKDGTMKECDLDEHYVRRSV